MYGFQSHSPPTQTPIKDYIIYLHFPVRSSDRSPARLQHARRSIILRQLIMRRLRLLVIRCWRLIRAVILLFVLWRRHGSRLGELCAFARAGVWCCVGRVASGLSAVIRVAIVRRIVIFVLLGSVKRACHWWCGAIVCWRWAERLVWWVVVFLLLLLLVVLA